MRDHFDAPLRHVEVVLANGDVVRTGMGALPNAKTWQQYRVWIRASRRRHLLAVELRDRHQDGFLVVPGARGVLSGNADGAEARRHSRARRDAGSPAELGRRSSATTSVLNTVDFGPPDPEPLESVWARRPSTSERYVAQKGLGYWTIDLPFYGPAKVIAAQWEYAKEKFSRIPGVTFRDGASCRFPLTRRRRSRRFPIRFRSACPASRPSPSEARAVRGHMWFSPIIPMTGEAVVEGDAGLPEQVYKDLGAPAGRFSLPIWSFFRASLRHHHFFPIERRGRTGRNREIFKRLVKTAAEHGWGRCPNAHRVHGRHCGRVLLLQQPRPVALARKH